MKPWEKYSASQQVGGTKPWERYGGQQAPRQSPVDQIDFSGPDLAVNSQIGLLRHQDKPQEALQADRIEALTRQQVHKQRAERAELPVWAQPVQGALDASVNFARGSIVGPLLDEAAAKINDFIPGGETGEQSLARTRAMNRIQDEDHTGASTVSKVAGAIVTGAPLFKGLGLLGGSLMGAGVGAAHGFGEAEGGLIDEEGGNIDDRLSTAKTGAQLGGAFGLAAPAITTGVVRLAKPLTDKIGTIRDGLRRDADDAAERLIARRLENEGTRPLDLADDIQRAAKHDTQLDSNSFLNPQASRPSLVPAGHANMNTKQTADMPGSVIGNNLDTLADQTPEMQRLAGSVHRSGGEGARIVKDTLDGRQIGPANRYAGPQPGEFPGQARMAEDLVERSMKIKGQNNAHTTEKQIVAVQKAEGDKLYTSAWNKAEGFDLVPALDEALATIKSYPKGGNIARKLASAAKLFGVPKQGMSLQRFDRAKQDLDDMISKARAKPNLKRELTRFKHSLLDRVHEGGKNQPYSNARAAWGSAAERRDAIQLGRDALKGDSDFTLDAFKALSPGDQVLVRIGFRKAIKNAQGSKRPGNDVTLLFQQQRVQELMGELIPRTSGRGTDAAFRNRPERFGNVLNTLGDQAKTRQGIFGGSQTAARVQDDLEFASDTVGSMVDRWKQNPSMANIALEAISSTFRRAFGFRQEVGTALARRLMETDPIERMKILRTIQRRMKPDRFKEFTTALDETMANLSSAVSRQAVGAE